METLKELTLFFKYAAKHKHTLGRHMQSSREDFLADVADDNLGPAKKYCGLPVLSGTFWLTRIDSIQCLLNNYRVVCEAVEEVRNAS